MSDKWTFIKDLKVETDYTESILTEEGKELLELCNVEQISFTVEFFCYLTVKLIKLTNA